MISNITSNIPLQEPATEIGQWTPETIQRFWEYYGMRSDLHTEYFSYQVGNGITTFLNDTGRVKPGISFLDYGCGPGFLLEKMLTKRARCNGIDGSSKAVELVNKKFQNNDDWMGAVAVADPPVPFPDRSFDVITCLETLEHVLEEQLPAVVSEVHRLLKPGGIALFTTPNNEDLRHNRIYCPFCQTSFHKIQHLRSFSKESLRSIVESQGFKIILCRGLNLASFQQQWTLPSWRDVSFRDLSNWLSKRKNALLDRVAPRPFPHGRGFKDRATSSSVPHLCALVERSD